MSVLRMPPPSSQVVLQTSWLRVKGPQDEQTCSWCGRWAGELLPLELKDSYARSHAAVSDGHDCRCALEPERLEVDAEDPDCLWA